MVAPLAVVGAHPRPEEEGEGETCSICFEPWTTAGDHRLATLRCGHLFGKTCIERWVKSQGQEAKEEAGSWCWGGGGGARKMLGYWRKPEGVPWRDGGKASNLKFSDSSFVL